MTAWAGDELAKIEATDELEIASVRDDATLRNPVTIWVVRLGDDLYVRSVNGRTSGWFRGAQDRHEAHVESGGVRLVMLAAVAAMLVASLAAPDAFGRDGVIFGVAYLVVRALHLVLLAIAGRGDRDLFGAVMRIVPSATLGPTLLIVAGFLD